MNFWNKINWILNIHFNTTVFKNYLLGSFLVFQIKFGNTVIQRRQSDWPISQCSCLQIYSVSWASSISNMTPYSIWDFKEESLMRTKILRTRPWLEQKPQISLEHFFSASICWHFNSVCKAKWTPCSLTCYTQGKLEPASMKS